MSKLTFHPTSTRSDSIHSFYAYDPYISKFWLPFLGPTATWLIEELCLNALIQRDTFQIETSLLSSKLGTGSGQGRSCPVNKQLTRLVNSGIIYQLSTDEYMVPKTINPLSPRELHKLDSTLQFEHSQWIQRLETCPLTTQRRRMKALLSRLGIMGVTASRTLEIVHSSGLHPSVIGEIALEASQQNEPA